MDSDSNPKSMSQPHLRFWCGTELIGEIFIRMDDLPGRDRWMLRLYPAEGENIYRPKKNTAVLHMDIPTDRPNGLSHYSAKGN